MHHVLVFSTSAPQATLTDKVIVGLLDEAGLTTTEVDLDWLALGQAADMPWDKSMAPGIAPLRHAQVTPKGLTPTL